MLWGVATQRLVASRPRRPNERHAAQVPRVHDTGRSLCRQSGIAWRHAERAVESRVSGPALISVCGP